MAWMRSGLASPGRRLAGLTLSVVLAAMAGPAAVTASSTTLYSQPPPANSSVPGVSGVNAEMADDFVVPSCRTWVIDEVYWVGTFDQSGGDIFVSFYKAGSGGIPGDLIARFQHLVATDGRNGPFATEDVVLPDEVVLPTGTYWVGFGKAVDNVIGVGSPPTTLGITGFAMVTRNSTVDWQSTSQSDASFELRGDDVACFTFSGFFQPVDNDVPNIAKAGQTIPVKWRLTDAAGQPVSDPASFVQVSSRPTTNACSGNGDLVETYTGTSGLQYLGDGMWQFNWKTPKSYAGQCRTMVLELSDRSTHMAEFAFR